MTDSDDWTRARLVVADVEGSGARPPELVELAVVEIENGIMKDEVREWLVRPPTPITSIVSRIHGITNRMVAHAPPFTEVAFAVREALGEGYLVGHNVQVDLEVLTRCLPGWKPQGTIDTLRLARELMPGRNSYSLTSLVADLKIAPDIGTSGRPHRAGYDARATARLFLRLARTDDGTRRTLSSMLEPSPKEPSTPPTQGKLF